MKKKRIDTADTLARFISEVDGFHDSILHGATLLSPGYVDADRFMWGDSELPNARLIIQSQFEDVVAVMIDLKRVSRFEVDPKLTFKLEGEVTPHNVVLYLYGKDTPNACKIVTAEIEYEMLGEEYLGKEYKLVHQGDDAEVG